MAAQHRDVLLMRARSNLARIKRTYAGMERNALLLLMHPEATHKQLQQVGTMLRDTKERIRAIEQSIDEAARRPAKTTNPA